MSGFDPFAGPGPHWFTIPARRPFLEDLAAGMLQWVGEATPEILTDLVVLVPNRRAARALGQALAQQSGDQPILLPQVRPLGDLEEDAPPFTPGSLGLELDPAIDPLSRQFELAQLVSDLSSEPLKFGHALELGKALGQFLDSQYLEEVTSVEALQGLVQGDMARHWKMSADLLTEATRRWPLRLAELGLSDPSWRRARLMRLLADQWQRDPPTGPVLVAGSVGPSPAAIAVLHAIAAAPRGAVVLPGLDQDLDPAAWNAIDEGHPQAALKRLLRGPDPDRPGVDRKSEVRLWPTPTRSANAMDAGQARERWLNEALRPAEATDDWRGAVARLQAEFAGQDAMALATSGLQLLSPRAEEDAAATIALLMRETLESPDRTCALVTPDLGLARRVEARLARWGIVPDSSGGLPLSQTGAGRLLLAAARFLEMPHDPVTLLALVKHPAVRQAEPGQEELPFNPVAIATLERLGLRGPAPRDWADLRRNLMRQAEPRSGETPESAQPRRPQVDQALAALTAIEALAARSGAGSLVSQPVDEATRRLIELVEALCGVDVWNGRDGEVAAELLAGLISAGGRAHPVVAAEFTELIRRLLGEQVVRLGNATHPRLQILGTVEARLIRADRMILAGLEEGVWPQGAQIDPFLSRPMRQALGLPSPERRVGEVAQDFIHAACGPEVFLISSERRGGQPTVRSRWLWRLDMLRKSGTAKTDPMPRHPVSDWTRLLDAPPPGPAAYSPRPAPTPPVHLRPRELPVTAVERWVRDPYAIYAERILGLKLLDRPDASAEALARGTALHSAMQTLAETWPDALPDLSADELADQIALWFRQALQDQGFDDVAMAREVPLTDNLSRWVVDFETSRRVPGLAIHAEQRGETTLASPHAPFVLTARADRIEVSPEGATILDFKTGTVPSAKEVAVGLAPQLTLTAAILSRGGFTGLGEIDANQLGYVRMTGRLDPGKVSLVAKPSKSDPNPGQTLATQALEGLLRRIERFDDPQTPYRSWEFPKYRGNFGGNYDHLARVWEWHVVGAGDEADEGGEA